MGDPQRKLPEAQNWSVDQYERAKSVVDSTDSKIDDDTREDLRQAVTWYEHTMLDGGAPDDAPDAGVPDEEPAEPATAEPVTAAPAQARFTPVAQATGTKPQAVPWYESFLRGGGEMAGMNLGDEMAGVGAWAADKTHPEDIPVHRDRTPYQAMSAGYRADNAHAQEVNPLWYLAGEGTGLLTTAALPAGKAVPAATWGARALQAARVGVPMGAVSAWGASTDPTPAGQFFDTLGGAEMGMIAAPVAGETVHQAANLGKPLAKGIGKLIASREAARIEAAHGPLAAERSLQAADPRSAAGQGIRKLLHAGESPEAIEAHARGITDEVTKLQQHLDSIEAYETIGRKAQVARKYFERDQVDPTAIANNADSIVRDTRQAVEEMLPHVSPGTDEARLIGRLQKQIGEYDLVPLDSTTATPYEVASDKWSRLDQIKREFQKNLRGVRFRSREVDALHGIEDKLVSDLENPQLWGDGATDLQIKRNRAWYRLLKLEQTRDMRPATTYMTDARGTPSASEENYRSLSEGDLGKVLHVVQGAGTPEGELGIWKLAEMADARANLGHALTDHIDPSAAMQARAADQGVSAGSIRQTLGQRAREAQMSNAITRGEQNLPDPGLVDRVLGAVVGAGERSPVGGAIRMMRPASRTLGQRARVIGQLENQLSILPNNRAATDALERMSPTIEPPVDNSYVFPGTARFHAFDRPSASAMAIRAAGRASSAGGRDDLEAVRMGADMLGPSKAKAQEQSQGHQLESVIEDALNTNPLVLGPYADRLYQAQQNGTLAQELFRLNSDTKFRTQIKPQLQR